MNRNSQSSSLNVVVIMILCIIVLVFVSVFFVTKMSDSSKKVGDVSDEFNDDPLVADFNDDGDRTHISIHVPYSEDPVDVSHRIPKSVIEELTYENREEFIESEKDYAILESDPLIAWHVERPPHIINYTIKKSISKDEIENFKVEITKSKKFNYVTYLFYLIILVIVIMVFKPLFIKSKKEKK